MADSQPGFVDLDGRAIRVKIALAVVGCLMLFHTLAVLTLVFTWRFDTWGWEIYDILGSLYPLGLVVTAAFWWVWHHGAQANLKVLGTAPRFSPAATVYWWLVPVANLVVPALVTADTSRTTLRLSQRPDPERPPVLAWWLLFVGGTVVSMLVANLSGSEVLPLTAGLVVETVAAGMIAASAWYGFRVVDRITSVQEAALRRW